MVQTSAEEIAQRAFDLGLVDERQMQEVWASLGSRHVSADDMLHFLVGRAILTNYQVERLVKGNRSGFFFGQYKVLYLVGAGTFARVYRAVHRQNGQIRALKVLRSRFSDSPAQFGQFLREGRMGCTLRHPNIVPIYEVVSEGKTHFFVMEFVEGRSLRDFVKIRKKLDPSEATKLMIGITDGMRCAFQHGVTHRDLKMSNILISSTGQPKLVDFGLASMDETVAEDDLDDMPNTRTIDYAALERATGVRRGDTRSDIYFLGCIYYNMLTGEPPLSETRDRLQRLSRSRFQDVVSLRQRDATIPDAVAAVVNKAMSLDPERRYQTPAAMVNDLRAAMRRLSGEAAAGNDAKSAEGQRSPDESGIGRWTAQDAHCIMVVESNAQMQDIFRNGLKRAGYRVLLTADPSRALGRLRQDATVAECVIFNAQQIGQQALDAFNEMAEDESVQTIPALLLLDETQEAWKGRARTANHRRVLRMPLTMKQLREALSQVVPAAKS